ncbi:prolyl-tRNA synthetase [Pseudovirgaria hyperparasitica]|uniref:proline--tRNA ligase n=1 Tax=Pseudovirgaria hyperparasitica TaxID=470096 RepID=A0A6A6VUX1_9PEZI|nr:prolyl-tRNA synthetase [Pseudovirgaria hyperparasitica]KAF2754362.1 prolyl-tRNA synthetase [Pseudovirgaria hyperparasitica]
MSISETTKKKESKKKEPKSKEPKNTQQKQAKAKTSKKNDDAALIGINVKKADDLADWYQQVITKGGMISFYDVSGCYILKPASYSIWEYIKEWFDAKIKSIGVENCYFPVFISEDNLTREKEHIEGFAAEVAWVTHGGQSKLEKRVAVRPTSETAMYSEFAREIRSHRDLPLKLNQWNNVVRWEFKHPMPFLRSREFLWQEGHTAHLTKEGAGKEVHQILDWYAGIYEELLAVPMVKGTKTNNEKFAGADYTTTVEGFIPATGRGIQGGTSHCLGQHFSKMFDIKVEDPDQKKEDGGEGKSKHLFVWQNSWGFTTRSIGVMVLTHGDDKGLVMPPRVAKIQAVIVPVGITAKLGEEGRAKLEEQVIAIAEVIKAANVRVHIDSREGYSPPWKFNDWEMKGVPLRIEVGPKDLEKHQVCTARRDTGEKGSIPITQLGTDVPTLLDTIQSDMFKRADAIYREHRKEITNWDDFVPALNSKNFCLIPHCEGDDCEDEIKKMSARTDTGDDVAEDARAPAMGAKSLCIPFDQPSGITLGETKCTNPNCKALAKSWVMFGRSY